MNGTRKAGLVLAAFATAMWLGAAAAFLSAGSEDGVSIGGALLALLAVPVSVGAAATLLLSLRGARHGVPPMLRAGAALAVLSVVALVAFLLIDPDGSPAAVQVTVLGVGVVAFLASSALFVAAGLPTGRRTV